MKHIVNISEQKKIFFFSEFGEALIRVCHSCDRIECYLLKFYSANFSYNFTVDLQS